MRPLRSASGVPFLAFAAVALGACATPTAPDTSHDQEEVGAAQQAVTDTCVTIQRGVWGLVADSSINEAYPGYTSGSDVNMITGLGRRSVFKFDLTGIPENQAVGSAHLSLKARSVHPSNSAFPDPVKVYAITAPWTEKSVTWANFNNAYDTTVHSTFGTIVAGARSTVDVTALVSGWLTNTRANHGLIVLAETANPNADVYWASSETSPNFTERPSLEVCYHPNACMQYNGRACGSGTCTEDSNDPRGFTCSCPPGITGPRCMNYDFCTRYAPCQNGGTCQNVIPPVSGQLPVTCTCPANFTGWNCSVPDCPAANADPLWASLVKRPGFEAIPSGMSAYWGQCNGIPFDPSPSRTWFHSSLQGTVSSSAKYAAYFNVNSPSWCNQVKPAYNLFATPIAGMLVVLDDPNSGLQYLGDLYGGYLSPATSQEAAACKAQFTLAPHINNDSQPVPDLPLPLALGVPGLLALAAFLRSRFGKQVAK